MEKQLRKKRGRLMLSCLFLVYSVISAAQAQTIHGKVTEAQSGTPLPGVSVVVKGTSFGATTDSNGSYSIQITGSNNVVVFSSIGYVTVEQTVSDDQTVVDVVLESDVRSLQEFVVVGYGVQKKEHLTGAVSSASMENYSKIPTGNALGALQGQVPGVSVSTGTGNPANAPQVRIRGLGSINIQDPLYVIDGIPGNPDYLNPAEIESISILKDASAASIYGSRGFGGVVMITTKRGKSGAPKLSFDSFVGVHQVNLNGLEPATRQQRNAIGTLAFADLPPWADPSEQANFANTNWADAYFKSAVEQKYDISLSGGTDDLAYSFQGGYYNHSGSVINSGMTRYNSRLNLDFKNLVHDRLNLSTNLAYSRKNIKNFFDDTGDGSGYSDIMNLFQTLPHKRIYDRNAANGYAGALDVGTLGNGNIIGERMLNRDRDQNDYIQANLTSEIKLIKGLSFKNSLGISVEDLYNDVFTQAYDFGGVNSVETPRVTQFRSRRNWFVVNNVLTYSTKIMKHDLTLLMGHSAEHNLYKSVLGSNRETPSPEVEALRAGIGVRNSDGSIAESSLLSYFGRASYSYDQKYFLEGSFRRDGSTRFGPKNRFGNFYSISAGWALHRESFFALDFITELKPRFSFGVVGNQNIPDFAFQSVIASGGTMLNYTFGPGNSPQALIGAISSGLSDPSIKWEENAMTNLGLDVGLFENRLSLSVDHFNAKAKDMLWVDPVPASTGIQDQPIRNVGTMENKGYEVNIKYRNSVGDFSYTVGVNLAGTRNKVIDFNQERIGGYVEYNNYATTLTTRGRPIGSFYLYDAVGLFKSQEEIDQYVNSNGDPLQPFAEPGDIKFRDVNKDGLIGDDDKRFFGTGIPKMELGFNFDATWKNFDVAFMVTGTFGNKMYNAFKHNTYRLGFNSDLTDAWSAINQRSDIPRLDILDPNGNYKVASDYFLENGAYVRLRNIQVGYTLPQELMDKLGVSRIRVFITGNNLLTFTKYTGFDPGLTNYGNFSRGVDRGYYPMSRSIVGGLSINF